MVLILVTRNITTLEQQINMIYHQHFYQIVTAGNPV